MFRTWSLFLCTRGGKEMWPFARPRPGTASRGETSPTRLSAGQKIWCGAVRISLRKNFVDIWVKKE